MNRSSYKDLKIWRDSMTEGVRLYKLLKDFPKYEQYSLCDQMRRCIISIPSNIAEGHARNSHKEFLNFLSISRGSIAELQTQIRFSIELGYLEPKTGEEFLFSFSGIDKMIRNLMDSIKSSN